MTPFERLVLAALCLRAEMPTLKVLVAEIGVERQRIWSALETLVERRLVDQLLPTAVFVPTLAGLDDIRRTIDNNAGVAQR